MEDYNSTSEIKLPETILNDIKLTSGRFKKYFKKSMTFEKIFK